MTTREDDAKTFAEAMGWHLDPPSEDILGDTWRFTSAKFEMWNAEHNQRIHTYAALPAPDAPLHEHLEFVGRIAEAAGPDRLGCVMRLRSGWSVSLLDDKGCLMGAYDAPDPSWAALKAATAARRTK